MDIAKDVWNDINNPMSAEIITGKTFTFLFRYHNRIKKSLFQRIEPGYDLIDIGYGKGGDIHKTAHFHKIVAVEPNQEHLSEAKSRLASCPPQEKKTKIVPCGGEQKDIIIQAAKDHFGWNTGPLRPLCIAMMLSLSFFWKDASTLHSLADTLLSLVQAYQEQGGTREVKFIFMTVDGESTLKLIEKKGSHFSIGPATLRFQKPNRVHIHIEDTIVTEQEEYLVYIQDLFDLMNASLLDIQTANQEKFLSKNEAEFTQLYIYGECSIPFQKTSKHPLLRQIYGDRPLAPLPHLQLRP
jgi:hypothetical protein